MSLASVAVSAHPVRAQRLQLQSSIPHFQHPLSPPPPQVQNSYHTCTQT